MTWSDVKKTLTTPPPSRRPARSKHPLFTKDFFSTKSFGPGHVVGAGILVLGVAGLTKLFIKHGHEGSRGPLRPPWSADIAQTDNARGEYGRKP